MSSAYLVLDDGWMAAERNRGISLETEVQIVGVDL